MCIRDSFETYQEAFKKIRDIEMMPISDKGKPNCWLSCMTLKQDSKVNPLDIMQALEKENIESRPVWKPMHLQPYFKDYDLSLIHISAAQAALEMKEK